MVSYYHSTTKKTKSEMIKKQKVTFSNFDVNKYVNHLLDTITIKDNVTDISTRYPGALRNAPYMGSGLYCFENKDEAVEYQSASSHDVVVVNMKDDISIYNMDDKEAKLAMFNLLNDQLQDFIEHRDDDDRVAWEALLEFLKRELYTDFEKIPELVGVMIHILREISPKIKYDVYLKEFCVKMNSKRMRYVLVKNKKAISSLV